MDGQIFANMLSDTVEPSQLLEMVLGTDTLGSVLRAHLICENLVEAWICSSCEQAAFFGAENSRLNIGFDTKLRIARNVGLPVPLYNALKTINTMRNEFAHNLGVKEIAQHHIDSLCDNVNNYMVRPTDVPVQKRYMDEFDENGDFMARHLISDKTTPNQKKLSIIVMEIFNKIVFTAAKRAVYPVAANDAQEYPT